MEDYLERRIPLGKTDLMAGPLGVGASYGVPAAAVAEAFERGCNLMYWGALRGAPMARAIREIIHAGRRDELIIVLQAMLRSGKGVEWSLIRGLRRLGIDYADVLLLGWYNHAPRKRLMDQVEPLRRRGLFRCLALSGHHRPLFPELARDSRFDLFWVRHNAANRGGERDLFPNLPRPRPGIVAFNATRRMSLVRSRRNTTDGRKPTPGDCYRFVLTNPSIDVVVTAPRTARQMRDNLDVVSRGPMNEPELDWMRRVGDDVYGDSRRF